MNCRRECGIVRVEEILVLVVREFERIALKGIFGIRDVYERNKDILGNIDYLENINIIFCVEHMI